MKHHGLFEELNDDNFDAYAVRNYNNPQCLSMDEFREDLARFKYIKRLLRKHRDCGEIRERLILNHLIVIYNVFPIVAANRMMFHKIDKELWPALKTFLVYLNYLPEDTLQDVAMDLLIAKRLKEI